MIVHLPFRFFRGKSAGDARSYRHGEGNLYGKEVYLGPGPGNHKFQSHHFQQKGEIVAKAQNEFTQHYPENGWVEHDPMEILFSQISAILTVLRKEAVDPKEIAAIGITNQRETTVVWEKETGRPIYNAIVWQCRRTADLCEELKAQGLNDYVKSTTGLLIDAYFSGTKIKWILDHVEAPGSRRSGASCCSAPSTAG